MREYNLAAFFDISPDIQCVLSKEGLFRQLNPALDTILGWQPADLLDQAFARRVHPDDAEQTGAQFEKLQSGIRMISFQNRYRCADGSHKELAWHISVESDSEFMFAIGRDLTGQKNLQAQVLHTQKLESLGILAGGIAHDLNNLLTGVLGNAELALLDMAPDADARTTVEDIHKSAVRAADFCKQLLAYSGRGSLKVGPIDLNRLVSDMARLLYASVLKNAVINYKLASGLPAVEGNTAQLQQVIMNLVANASDAVGKENGVITISTGIRKCDRAYFKDTFIDDKLPAGNYVFLEVLDTGCGMEKEEQKKVFQPFHTTKESGQGLGLAAVLGIVRTYKGAVEIISHKGQGAIFRIFLPVSKKASEEIVSRAVEQDQPWPECGPILVIDDEVSVRQVVERSIKRVGGTVIAAADGSAGVKIFEEKKAELALVLVDLSMPNLNGEAVLRHIRRLDADLPVILTSGYAEEELRSRFAGHGFTDFIEKPIEINVLMQKLRKAL